MSKQTKAVNVIFADGSIPPVMAAALCIKNGCDTYVYLERGRIFHGIDNVEKFNNIGFDTERTTSIDDHRPFDLTISTLQELKKEGITFFNFYCGESRGLKCVALAANAGLEKGEFHIYLLEDGIDTYKKFAYNYGGDCRYQALRIFLFRITKRKWFSEHASKWIHNHITLKLEQHNPLNKTCQKLADKYVAKYFTDNIRFVQNKFNEIISCDNNNCIDDIFEPNYILPFPLACLDNFTYYIQSPEKIRSIVKRSHSEKLFKFFCLDEKSPIDTPVKYHESKLSSLVSSLNNQQLNQYLTLVFGNHKDEIKNIFTRKERAGLPAPERKLVYVNARLNTSFIKPATSPLFGMSELEDDGLDLDYSSLDDKYKSMYLFPCREDWEILYLPLKKYILDTEPSVEIKKNSVKKIFSVYSNYIFIAKLIYGIFGSEYDIIIKNHPRTDVGRSDEWADIYKLGHSSGGLVIDEALANFHKSDSIGKYINLISASPSTENFEYIGADVSFGGQPTSAYNGLSDNAQINFIITETTKPISSEGDSHFNHSSIAARYNAGKMYWQDVNGNRHKTLFLNTINTLKYCWLAAQKHGDEKTAVRYKKLYTDILNKAYPDAKDIDAQGFIKK